MSKEREPCQIIEKAKVRAKDMGLEPKKVQCPADHVCNGSCCIFNGEPVPDMGMIDRFNKRKEKRENE